MNRLESAGTASQGVHHIAKIVSANNSVFQSIAQENDIGNDAYIEFVLNQRSTGCCIAAQIKSGKSYLNNGAFTIPSNSAHRHYWIDHILPVAGIVYDPVTDTARWIDLTDYLKNHEETTEHHAIVLPEENLLDLDGFARMRQHFLTYKDTYSNDSHFVEALKGLAKIDDSGRTFSAIRSLFAFHRNRIETWFYIISCLRHFHDSPVMRSLVIALCHVPGHTDIFWGKSNIIQEETRKEALRLLRRLTTRDDVLSMIAAIDENGIDRGQIGQCVHAIVEVVDDNVSKLTSIASDVTVDDDSRYWAFILIILVLQSVDLPRTIKLTEQLRHNMPAEHNVEVSMLCESLKVHGYVGCF